MSTHLNEAPAVTYQFMAQLESLTKVKGIEMRKLAENAAVLYSRIVNKSAEKRLNIILEEYDE